MVIRDSVIERCSSPFDFRPSAFLGPGVYVKQRNKALSVAQPSQSPISTARPVQRVPKKVVPKRPERTALLTFPVDRLN